MADEKFKMSTHDTAFKRTQFKVTLNSNCRFDKGCELANSYSRATGESFCCENAKTLFANGILQLMKGDGERVGNRVRGTLTEFATNFLAKRCQQNSLSGEQTDEEMEAWAKCVAGEGYLDVWMELGPKSKQLHAHGNLVLGLYVPDSSRVKSRYWPKSLECRLRQKDVGRNFRDWLNIYATSEQECHFGQKGWYVFCSVNKEATKWLQYASKQEAVV